VTALLLKTWCVSLGAWFQTKCQSLQPESSRHAGVQRMHVEFKKCMWKHTPVRSTPSHLCSKWSCRCRLWCSEQYGALQSCGALKIYCISLSTTAIRTKAILPPQYYTELKDQLRALAAVLLGEPSVHTL